MLISNPVAISVTNAEAPAMATNMPIFRRRDLSGSAGAMSRLLEFLLHGLLSVKMSNRTVTGYARSRSCFASVRTLDRFNDLLVTLPARSLRHGAAVRPHLDIVFKPAGGEIEGMPETVP